MTEQVKEQVKQQTLELYDSLPQDKEERIKRLDVRDKVIELNYSFFGYVATTTFINNNFISYEDKFQSVVCHFCECWWWYKWAERYRTDLSFAVFFKPRLGEMLERELNEVKYSLRRALCMKVGEQLGKHWGRVKYDDLKHVSLPPDEMNSLKAMFGSMYVADLETHALFIEDKEHFPSIYDSMDDRYDSIEELLIHEMVSSERKLDYKDLKKMSEIYDIPIADLQSKIHVAEDTLYTRLKSIQDIRDTFTSN